ncbi:MAG: 30S ribosomal protein S6 [Chloroflexi bacterium]|nr:30S ribosomal protein S6 [Chloroflexota bacterium]
MHTYELMVIIHPDLDDEAVNQAMDKIKSWIETGKGKITEIQEWGKRRLAYPIQKQYEGLYYLLNLELDPTNNAELERNIRILEPVMRYMLIAK